MEGKRRKRGTAGGCSPQGRNARGTGRTEQHERLERIARYAGAGRYGRRHGQPRICHGHAARHPAGGVYRQDTIVAPGGQPAADSEYRGRSVRA